METRTVPSLYMRIFASVDVWQKDDHGEGGTDLAERAKTTRNTVGFNRQLLLFQSKFMAILIRSGKINTMNGVGLFGTGPLPMLHLPGQSAGQAFRR
ncbi:hypothetical protein [Streptomyces sp. NK15101]|uniref:hypothetical protein n=1 Tax=Streptomyces sp. NK15101 TaxID=2873261 RepID=UPI001CEC638B|nr:hypothetical protein [Streptomyces sp. NK15101]